MQDRAFQTGSRGELGEHAGRHRAAAERAPVGMPPGDGRMQIPMLIFVPLAGLLSDRYDRRKLMIAAYALAAVQASALGLLALSGTIRVWQILLLGFLHGVIMAFETPARQSLISQMVNSRDDLPNAIALNSVLMNSGRLIGPSIAGLLLVFISEGWCFLINSASFIAIIASVCMMKLAAKPRAKTSGSLLGEFAVAAVCGSNLMRCHGKRRGGEACQARWGQRHSGESGCSVLEGYRACGRSGARSNDRDGRTEGDGLVQE